jgi:hypothetical protein
MREHQIEQLIEFVKFSVSFSKFRVCVDFWKNHRSFS